MKVFMVGDFPKDDKTYGGVEGVLINLTSELLNREDIELVLISLSIDSDFTRFETICKTYKLDFRSSFLWSRKRFDHIYKIEKPNVIHLQGTVPGVLLYKKEYNKRFIVTQHAILHQERLWQTSLKRNFLFRVKELIENYYFKRIGNFIFISKYNRDIFFEKFSKNKNLKHELIPNPVNNFFFNHDNNTGPQVQNELYFVGEIKKRKGLHILLKALAILKQKGYDGKLHVIGGFKEINYEAEINRLVDSLNLSNSIVFCGWKNQKEIIEYIENIPVFVLPSFQETLPLSIAEAMCRGKIVVATDICGIPEMIEDGKSGYLFPPGNHTALSDILEKLFSNRNLREDISRNAIASSKKYNSKKVANKTIGFYKSFI